MEKNRNLKCANSNRFTYQINPGGEMKTKQFHFIFLEEDEVVVFIDSKTKKLISIDIDTIRKHGVIDDPEVSAVFPVPM